MRNSKTILDEMELIDFANQCLKNKIAENMANREELLREFNEAKKQENEDYLNELYPWRESEAKSAFIADQEGLKKVGEYL